MKVKNLFKNIVYFCSISFIISGCTGQNLNLTTSAEVSSQTQYSYDNYSKGKKILSPVFVFYTKDYAYVKELLSYDLNKKDKVELVVSAENSKWYFFNEALDSNGNKLNFISLKKDVTRDGFRQESFVIIFNKEEIENYRKLGLFFKVYGTNSSTEIYLAPNYIDGFLNRANKE